MTPKIFELFSTLNKKEKYAVGRLVRALSSDEKDPRLVKPVRKAIRQLSPMQSDGRKQPNSYMVFAHAMTPI